jgi:hypothetical protein
VVVEFRKMGTLFSLPIVAGLAGLGLVRWGSMRPREFSDGEGALVVIFGLSDVIPLGVTRLWWISPVPLRTYDAPEYNHMCFNKRLLVQRFGSHTHHPDEFDIDFSVSHLCSSDLINASTAQSQPTMANPSCD